MMKKIQLIMVILLLLMWHGGTLIAGQPATWHLQNDDSEPCPAGTGLDFSGQDLTGTDFSGQDLTCADFTQANLNGANLRNAILKYVIFTGADLTGADLYGADLTDAIITGVRWDSSICPDGRYAWSDTTEEDQLTACPVPTSKGLPSSLPTDLPNPTMVLIGGGQFEKIDDIAPVKVSAVWETCPCLVTEAEATPHTRACVQSYTDAGIMYLSYHPFPWVEQCFTGWQGIQEAYPRLADEGVWRDFDGNIYLRDPGGGEPVPLFSHSSDVWLNEFLIPMFKTQVDAGMTGGGVDESWGTVFGTTWYDFSPAAMEGFRQYLAVRYTDVELAERGVTDISTFNWRDAMRNKEVYVYWEGDPWDGFTLNWWETVLGRPLQLGETYTKETLELAQGYQAPEPLIGLVYSDYPSDYEYYMRKRLREVYEKIQADMKAYAAERGQPWYLTGNQGQFLDWNNAAVLTPVLDFPMAEVQIPEEMWPSHWPERNFTAFYKNIAALGKRFGAMDRPGQNLYPRNDDNTEGLLVFLADAYASGGISHHPGSQYNEMVNPFYILIQLRENLFAESDNRVAVYYSLGNHMGDVGRRGVEEWTYYGAARLLEDSHYSYDVLYQGDPDMGPGTIRWVDKQVSLPEMQRYDVIVLPNTRYMTDTEVQNFLDFVNAGGILVVFGDAGTHDFGFPTPNLRTNTTWSDLVRAEGIRAHGAGHVRVFPKEGDENLARRYDTSFAAADLANFQAALEGIYPSGIRTTFDKHVHIHKFRDPVSEIEVFHLVNFDYDKETDLVRPTGDQIFAFKPRESYVQPQVIYYTPESPQGVFLPIIPSDPDRIEVTVPGLHVYGIVVLGETPPSTADLVLLMNASNTTPKETETIAYTVTLINNGPEAATHVKVKVLLPSGVTYDSASPSQGSYFPTTGIWSVASLANGASITLTVNVRVRIGTLGSVNTARAIITESDQNDSDMGSNTASADVTVSSVPTADLEINKTIDNSIPTENDKITYTVTLTNNGQDDTAFVKVTDHLPPGLSFVSADTTQGSYSPGTGLWTLGSLANGLSATLTIIAKVDSGTVGDTITNTASITASDLPDPVPETNTAHADITVSQVDLELYKTVNNVEPVEGDTISYTMTIQNSGPSEATGIEVTDLLPSGLSFVSADATQGDYAQETGIWTVGSLSDDMAAMLTIAAGVDSETAGQTITNTVRVTAVDQADSNSTNDSAGAVISVKSHNQAPVAAEQDLTTEEDSALTITLSADDPDGDTLFYSVVTHPAHGTLSGTAPNLTYIPDSDYFGADSFTFKATDGEVDSNVATVTIEILNAVIAGDVDDSGTIDLTDAILALRVVSETSPGTSVYKAADVTGDGNIGLDEAIFILQRLSRVRP